MYHHGEDVYYYVSLYNENYVQPAKPDGVDEAIVKGLYRFAEAPDLGRKAHRARLVGSGSILQQVIAAQGLLAEKAGIAAEIYCAPSFPLLRRDALEAERWNRLHPTETPRVPYVTTVLGPDGGPIVAATDWLKALPDMVARWLPPYYVSLGTDGFGRSDTREALRSLFEIDPPHIAAAVLTGLARCGAMPAAKVAAAVADLGVDPAKLDPVGL
jgi:pyruvate dehydrogenase E1 component